MIEMEEKGMKLAEQHWIYIRNLLTVHGEDTKVIEKIGFHYMQAMKHGYKHGILDNVTNENNVTNITKVTDLTNINKSEDIQEEQTSKTSSEPITKRTKKGKWKKTIEAGELLKEYGTIKIWSGIKDYIWDGLPVDFKHEDVQNLFKKAYTKLIGGKMKTSSYRTYASRYIRYFKEQDPPIISWFDWNLSKDVDKYTEENIEPVEGVKPESGGLWEPWEIKVLKDFAPTETPEYIHVGYLSHRTVKAITRKTQKLGIVKITDSNQARRDMLDSSTKASKDIHEHKRIDVHEHAHALESKKPSVSDETKEMLESERLESERIESEKIAAEKISKNPFYEGTAEHHLYQLAINSNWFVFKNGTPFIMIDKQMSEFPKDQIHEAMNILIKRKKAKRLPNKFLLFLK